MHRVLGGPLSFRVAPVQPDDGEARKEDRVKPATVITGVDDGASVELVRSRPVGVLRRRWDWGGTTIELAYRTDDDLRGNS